MNTHMEQYRYFERECGEVVCLSESQMRIVKGVLHACDLTKPQHPLAQFQHMCTYTHPCYPSTRCLCGHSKILYVSKIENIHTGKVVDMIGSECIQTAFDYNNLAETVAEHVKQAKKERIGTQKQKAECTVKTCQRQTVTGGVCGRCYKELGQKYKTSEALKAIKRDITKYKADGDKKFQCVKLIPPGHKKYLLHYCMTKTLKAGVPIVRQVNNSTGKVIYRVKKVDACAT